MSAKRKQGLRSEECQRSADSVPDAFLNALSVMQNYYMSVPAEACVSCFVVAAVFLVRF